MCDWEFNECCMYTLYTLYTLYTSFPAPNFPL